MPSETNATNATNADNAGGTLEDFVAPPDSYQAYLIDAIFMPGTSTP